MLRYQHAANLKTTKTIKTSSTVCFHVTFIKGSHSNRLNTLLQFRFIVNTNAALYYTVVFFSINKAKFLLIDVLVRYKRKKQGRKNKAFFSANNIY